MKYAVDKRVDNKRGEASCISLRLNFCTFAGMWIEVLKSKIHRVEVTEANLHYAGSITIDEALMEAADIVENQKVQVVNVNNGERFETYVIKGERNSGVICLNGPAARKAVVGDIIIILAYAWMEPEEARRHKPIVLIPKPGNRL